MTVKLAISNSPIRMDLNERKTKDKNELITLSRRNQELEHAMTYETIVSEELRTKLAVATESPVSYTHLTLPTTPYV